MPEKVSILAVLVLYRLPLEDSTTWKAICKQVDAALLAQVEIHLLICDNGPLPIVPPALPAWAEYAGVLENHGLAWAYNRGLALAKMRGAGWLLTLDQDTSLPPDYFIRMAREARDVGTEEKIAAIVPQLVSETRSVHSPVLSHWYGEQKIRSGFSGIADGEVRAFNSGALVRVSALDAIGGYDARFWMNYLDHSTFYGLQQDGSRIWIAGDIQVRHHLSLHEGRDRMSEQHFHHFSAAESAFRDLHASWFERLFFTGRLLLRAINQKRRGDPAHFSETTLCILKQRLLLSRKQRVRRWEAEVAPMAMDPSQTDQVTGAAS